MDRLIPDTDRLPSDTDLRAPEPAAEEASLPVGLTDVRDARVPPLGRLSLLTDLERDDLAVASLRIPEARLCLPDTDPPEPCTSEYFGFSTGFQNSS
mmetsp:Transcript_71302/g.128339  ORF Transcript_71302/g.128339 Transcript_71302/m.128339 type:complete len:97 (+) Transcript_71302:440-730(+)